MLFVPRHASLRAGYQRRYCKRCRASGAAERHRVASRRSGSKLREYQKRYKAQRRKEAGALSVSERKSNARKRRETRRAANPLVQVGHYRATNELPSTVDGARYILKDTLIALLQRRCDEAGLLRDSVQYATKYRTNPAFRAKEKAKTAGQKKKRGVLVSPDGSLTPEVVRRLFATTSVCPYCDALMRSRDKSLDHLHPVSRGGQHVLGNVTVCCKSCNSRKRDATWSAWLRRLPPQIAARFTAHRVAA